ncbi:MAG: bifunctional transaldolase/phosoglucose isomerase, partial [Candidatus Eiseniibacteriota bacterium]
ASTSTKNPKYSDVLYVAELIGPHTVNTIPPATLDAFRDHGKVRGNTILEKVDEAITQLDQLKQVGVDLHAVGEQLQVEGVASFSKSFDDLMGALDKKRAMLLSSQTDVESQNLGAIGTAVEKRLAAWCKDDYCKRMWAKDFTLWSAKPVPEITDRLGWLHLPETMHTHVQDLTQLREQIKKEGFTHAVLLGMGGSSLAPEVLRLTLGVGAGGLELAVLDNTSPEAVRAVASAHDPHRTLFLVSSKSGGTLEVTSFEKHFFEWVRAARGDQAGRSFVAITDPGTSLEQLARTRGYRRTFINPPDIGGRYSALSFFGLVPAALLRADLDALLAGAADEASASGPEVPARQNPSLVLGAALGELALSGRTKLTLVLPPEWSALGSWIEQLVAESTGKLGRGIVPVTEEPLGVPEQYGRDRLFVAVEPASLSTSEIARLAALESAGHPVLRWSHRTGATNGPSEKPALSLANALGAEFLRWEIATAVAGAILSLDPFDEPNVAEAKQASQDVLKRWLTTGRFDPPAPAAVARAGDVQLFAPAAVASHLREAASGGPFAAAATLISLGRPGDYMGLLAYLCRTRERHDRLQRLRVAMRDTSRLATTLGYGPRFLHSTGQLHKGGANTGVFLQFTADEGDDEAIPGESYGFATLRRAQADGDYQVLEKRERRVARLHLGSKVEESLDALITALEARARSYRYSGNA